MPGFAGTERGSFFEAPDWVDRSKPPGHTSLAPLYAQPGWWRGLFHLDFFINSPNLVWFLIALTLYNVFPYDLEAGKTWACGWVLERAVVNVASTFIYFTFWTATTYYLRWTSRKYKQSNLGPSLSRMLHNVWFAFLGCLTFTGWEVAFIHLYATGRLQYIPNAEVFSSVWNAATTILLIMLVPLWEEIHFYFSHRFLHVRVLYKYVHCVHHRNTDVDPFGGFVFFRSGMVDE